MKRKTWLVISASVVILSMLLTGCGNLFGTSFDAAKYVKGNIDSIYLGVFSKEFMDIVVDTEAELKEQHELGLQAEAEFFMHYFDIADDALTDDMRKEIIEMYRQIYTHSRYEVGEATKSGDTYLVSVTIYPMDIMSRIVEEDVEPFMDLWIARDGAGEFDNMSIEDIERVWARDIIDLVKARINSIGYLDPQTISVQVNLNKSNGQEVWIIDDHDFSRIDAYIIAY